MSLQAIATKPLSSKSFKNIANDMLNQPSEQPPIQRSRALKWGLSICTTIYILLLPPLFYMAVLSSMVSDGPSVTPLAVGIVMFMMFWIPISIPVSIYLMWSRYCRHQCNRACVYSLLPVGTFAVVFVLVSIILHLCDAIDRIGK